MDRERWDRVKQILSACLELEPAQREAYLVQACGGDAELLAEVRSLLDTNEEMGEFLEAPLPEPQNEALLTGCQIGSYQICELIGEGGMGAVYRAVRANDFEKQVALKVVKRGMDTDFILRRFRQERQILAALDHPNIARLLDGGATADGRPYLVMEYVQGTPVTAYAESQRLSESERMALFRTICSAVEYAHRNLVVHRDLKPGNILVQAGGVPKLLDFGIAKLLQPEADTTQPSIRMLSPECASPEQVRGEAITTATDVYSLGVLLYHLLAGQPPYQFPTGSAAEIARVVCETEPKRPGSIRPVHADLDNIALKAMDKDPTRRYASVEQLSEDIRRHLAGLPVLARNDTIAYRVSKFFRRHTAASIAASLAVLSLLGGMTATLWQAHRSAVEQQIATAVSDFLRNDVLAQASSLAQAGPGSKADPDLTVRTALDRAAVRIEGKFKGQPLVEASIRQTMGDAYEELGLFGQAQPHIQRALDLRRATLGENHPDTLASMNSLAGLLGDQGKYAEAEALQAKVLDLRRRVLGERDAATLASMNSLGTFEKHLGHDAQAEVLLTRSLELRRQILGANDTATLVSMNDLATLYEDQGKYTQAEPLYLQAQDVRRKLLGEEHPYTLTGWNNLASLYSHQGKYAQAEEITTKVLETRRRVLGQDHPLTITSMNNLAVERVRQGKLTQAEPLLSQVLEIRERKLGEDNLDTLTSMNNLAFLYRQESKDAPAEALYRKTLAGRRRLQGNQHPDTLLAIGNLSSLLLRDHKFSEAEILSREAVKTYEKGNSSSWQRYNVETLLGASLAGEKRYAEAEPFLLSGYQGMLERQASIPAANRANLKQGVTWIGQLYTDWNKPLKAAEWKNKIEPAH